MSNLEIRLTAEDGTVLVIKALGKRPVEEIIGNVVACHAEGRAIHLKFELDPTECAIEPRARP